MTTTTHLQKQQSVIAALRTFSFNSPNNNAAQTFLESERKEYENIQHRRDEKDKQQQQQISPRIPKLLVKPHPDSLSGKCNVALHRAARAVEAQQLLRCVIQWENVCQPLWTELAKEAANENRTKWNHPDTPGIQAQYRSAFARPDDGAFQLSYTGYNNVIMKNVDPMRQKALDKLDPRDRIEVAAESCINELVMQNEQHEQDGNKSSVMSREEIEEAAEHTADSLRAIYRTSFPFLDEELDERERQILLTEYADFLPKVDAALFMSCPRNAKTGTVDVRVLYELLQVQIAVAKFAAEMLLMDPSGERQIASPEQLEAYVEDTLPGIPGFQSIMRRQLVPAYKIVQVERFMWQLDKRNLGRFELKQLLVAQDLKDMLLHQLKPEELSVHPSEGVRWFACQNTLRLYDEFNRLDARRKRLLTLGDFRKYRRVLLTNAEAIAAAASGAHPISHYNTSSPLPADVSPLSFSFVKRYFETVPNVMQNGEMDFRSFVQFVLMVELLPEKRPRTGLFFDIFDADGLGVLTPTKMSRFMLETRVKLANEFDSYGATAERQVDDLFHLIKTKTPYEITKKEFVDSVNNGLFCALAIDCVALMTYEQRDWTNPKLKQEELMQRPFSGRR